jgi:hypothetical protein
MPRPGSSDGPLRAPAEADAAISARHPPPRLPGILGAAAAASHDSAAIFSPGAGCRVPLTEQRGIALPQVRRLYEVARVRCAREGWLDGRTGKLVHADDINLYHLVDNLIKGATRGGDGEAPMSLMERVSRGAQPPKWFVTHQWAERVADFIACLEGHCHDRGLDEATTYYWVCAYANNQWQLEQEMPSNDIPRSSFYRTIELPTVEGIVAVLGDGGPFARIWCILEMYLALVSGLAKRFDAYTRLPGGKVVGLCDGVPDIDERTGSGTLASRKAKRESEFPLALVDSAICVDVREAKAFFEGDRLAITAHIDEANFDALNATLAASFDAVRRAQLMRSGPLEEFEQHLARL